MENNIATIAKVLMMTMEDCGIIIDDYEKMKLFIYHAFNDNRIKFFQVDGQQAGFMMWEVKYGAVHIFQLVVLPKFRGYNFLKEVRYLKERYPDKAIISGDRFKNGKHNYRQKLLKKELTYV